MYLGINLGHDSSVAITDESGVVLHAISEERLSRIKIHTGIPVKAIELLGRYHNLYEIKNVVIGNNKTLRPELLRRMLADLEYPMYRKSGLNQPVNPGLPIPTEQTKIHENFFVAIKKLLGDSKNIFMPKHHDSHLGCAIGVANIGKSALLLSLDGKGDGESGAVSSMNNDEKSSSSSYTEHARFPTLDSLGLLYSAVTQAYNFQPGNHEGKITGLAAYGSYSEAVDVLLKYVTVLNGIPTINQVKGFKERFLRRSLNRVGLGKFAAKSLEEIVSIAESKTFNYPDLAFAIQTVLEKSVIEIVTHWQKKLSCETLALTGGVFANVKLNQKLSELELFHDVRIFPNMGDGGIALGGIWFELYKTGRLSKSTLFNNMFLAPDLNSDDNIFFEKILAEKNLNLEKIKSEDLATHIALLLSKGQIGSIHKGKMEFGPRALCNRSILADPRNNNINVQLNERLKRTEFMPFAPAVKQERFTDYFEISSSQSIFPFKFMTMTCNVKPEFAKKFPAVVHIDGTARPQIIDKSEDKIMWEILDEFEKLSGVGILVNTSFNMHEEPINYRLEDSIEALRKKAVDFLIYNNYLIKNNEF